MGEMSKLVLDLVDRAELRIGDDTGKGLGAFLLFAFHCRYFHLAVFFVIALLKESPLAI